LEQLLPFAFQHSFKQYPPPNPPESSPVLPDPPSPTFGATRRLLAPTLEQDTPLPNSLDFNDSLWSDFDIPIQEQDFAMYSDIAEHNPAWDNQCFDIPRTSINTPSIAASTPFIAPIPPPPLPNPNSPAVPQVEKLKRKKRTLEKDPKRKKQKKLKKKTIPPPTRITPSEQLPLDHIILPDDTTKSINEDQSVSWEEFLAASDTEPTYEQHEKHQREEPPSQAPVPITLPSIPIQNPARVVAFTAVNSTIDSTLEFTARQILLNSESPASSPDNPSQSPSAQTESYSSSPIVFTPIETTQDPTPDNPNQVLKDLTSEIINTTIPTNEKRPRGRPKGWRKPKSCIPPTLPDISTHKTPQLPIVKPVSIEKPFRASKKNKKDDENWSMRIRSNIRGHMLDHISKGIFP
jgi:hypothetical protein